MAKEKVEKAISKSKLDEIEKKLKASSKKNKIEISYKEVFNWLFDGLNTESIPHKFLYGKARVEQIIKFGVIPKFRTCPKAVNFLNVHLNDLYSRRTTDEILIFLKSYIQMNKILLQDLDSNFYQKSLRDGFIEEQSEIFGTAEKGFGDIVAEFDMLQTGRFSNGVEAIIATSNVSENFDQNALELLQLLDIKKIENDPRFIKKLDQETIDSVGLTLIDIKAIEKQNKIILVFIDGNNKKKFYLMDFTYEFALSSINSIIYNDYIMPFDPRYFTCVVLTDTRTVDNLRRQINANRDNHIRLNAWGS